MAIESTFSWSRYMAAADPGFRGIARLNHIAAQLGSVHSGPPITSSTLMLAFFAARDPFSRWLQRRPEAMDQRKRIADAAQFSLDEVRDAGAAAATTLLPGVLWAPSATKIGDASHAIVVKILGHEPTAMEPEHFFAAYCFGEGCDERELAAWGFDRTAWTRRLLAWVAIRRNQELSGWLGAVVRSPTIVVPRLYARGGEQVASDVEAALDALATASDGPFAKFAQTRGWQIEPLPSSGSAALAGLDTSAELECWMGFAQVMGFPGPEISHTGVLAAAVAAPPDALPSVSAWFDRIGTSLEAEAPEIWAWLVANNPSSEPIWTEVRDIWAEIEAPRLSGFDNDEARGGVDRLEFKRDVAALAQLLAANEDHGITPPLSVGLFGEWGSGKTFFMDMLEKQIDVLKASGEPAFCERIVQIRFNAWHYMDTNLWASLAAHLFGDLDRQLVRDETEAQRDARVTQQLASSRAEAERLDREKTSLETQLHALRAQAAAAEKTRHDRRLELADLRPADVRTVLAGSPDLAAKLSKLDEAARASSIVRALFGRYTIGFLIATFAVLAAGLYAGNAVLSQLTSVVGGLLSVGAAVVGVVRRAIPRSEELIALVTEIEARIRARPTEDEERIGRDIAAVDLRYQELVGACSRLATDVARLEVDKQRLADGRNFAKYVLQRNQSDDYRKQLGIVSTLQRDFDELSRRLLVDDGGARVQRIVLYIDDLDRCPADKVVQVLQSVHLLLSFRLFVVVVAVDPKWVLRSLEEHYVKQMGGDIDGRTPAATPHAYLEKIFQISMRVRRMGTEAYGRLIDGLAGKQLATASAAPGGNAGIRGAPADRVRDQSADATPDAASAPEPTNTGTGMTERPAGGSARDPALTGEALTLEPREVEYLKLLGDLVPTPRAAKRLVNVYRLIRVQLTPAERVQFVREHDGTFHAVMLFLALSARFPAQALELFDRIIDGKCAANNWPDLRAQLEPEPGHDRDWAEMWAAIPSVTTAGLSSLSLPVTSLRWSQLRAAAILAERYSLPGPRRNPDD